MSDSIITRRDVFAVKKREKYLLQYQNMKAEWTTAIDRAWFFRDCDFAQGFAWRTKGYVVSVEIIVKKYGK